MTLVRTAVLQDSLVKIVTRFVPSLAIVAIVTGSLVIASVPLGLLGPTVMQGAHPSTGAQIV